MTNTVGDNVIDIDELICPITMEIFYDPVIAKDGHIYEREAITKWILERGTSPFTRETLQINELQPDDRLRNLTKQYQTRSWTKKCEKIIRCHVIRALRNNDLPVEDRPTMKLIRIIYSILICLITCLAGFTLVMVAGAMNGYPADRNVTSHYSGVFVKESSTYIVNPDYIYRYEKIRVIISTSGTYRFECRGHSYPYFIYVGTMNLYRHHFNAKNLSMNRLTYDYVGGGLHRSSFTVSLRSDNYILVVGTTDISAKSFSILVNGPAHVGLSQIINT